MGGGQPAKAGRRVGAKRGWFTCENGQLTGEQSTRTSPVSNREIAEMRFLQGLLTLNQSFAAVHLVAAPRKRRKSWEDDEAAVGIRELCTLCNDRTGIWQARTTVPRNSFFEAEESEGSEDPFRLREPADCASRASRAMEGWRVPPTSWNCLLFYADVDDALLPSVPGIIER